MTHGRLGYAIAGATFAALLMAPAAPRVAAADPPCELTGVDRIVAVGDVHGAYDRFVGILQTTGLLDAKLRWIGGKTHLVQLGDIVDRGPDSRKALDLMQRLEKDAARAGGAVHQLIGNHEAMRMLGDLRYTTPGEYKAFVSDQAEDLKKAYVNLFPAKDWDQIAKETPLGMVEMSLGFGRKGIYGDWLRRQNAVIKIDGILFVHGGIAPMVADLSCDAINDGVRRDLTEDFDKTREKPDMTLAAGDNGPLWYRGLAEEPETFLPEVDAILAKQKVRAIVVGHTVTPDARIRSRFGGKVFQIDTGMQPAYVERGRASALEILNGVFTAIYMDRRDALPSSPAVPTVTPVPAPQ